MDGRRRLRGAALNGMYPGSSGASWVSPRSRSTFQSRTSGSQTAAEEHDACAVGATRSPLLVSQPSLEPAKPAHGHVMTDPPRSSTWTPRPADAAAIQLYPVGGHLHPQRRPRDLAGGEDPRGLRGYPRALGLQPRDSDALRHLQRVDRGEPHARFHAPRPLVPEAPLLGTLFATDAIKGTMDEEGSAQTQVYGTGLRARTRWSRQLFQDFDFQEYDPEVDFELRGVDEPASCPASTTRDALQIVEGGQGIRERDDGSLLPERPGREGRPGAPGVDDRDGIAAGGQHQGLPFERQSRNRYPRRSVRVLTAVVFTVTSSHSSIENAGPAVLACRPTRFHIVWPHQNSAAQMDRQQVADALPEIGAAIHGYGLVASAKFDPHKRGSWGAPTGRAGRLAERNAPDIPKWRARWPDRSGHRRRKGSWSWTGSRPTRR